MPPVVNTAGCKAGSIYRIKLENFVTYKSLELYPGRSLNMIIGPNGSGKSTFVSALILGLCGNIASIGRAKKISEYVRVGSDEATTEIDLYQETGQPNVKITRVFDRKEVSKWYIDNKPVPLVRVKELIAKYSIQVDNLCQLMPQDRVKDFALTKPHALLENTLLAIGEQKRVDELKELKNWRSQQCGLTSRIQKNEKRRADLIKENEILQGRIDTYNQRKELDTEIKVCNCKKLWLEADILKSECKKFEKDKKAAEATFKTQEKKIQPLKDSLKEIDDEIKELENEKLSLNTKINKAKDQMDDFLRAVKLQNDRIESHRTWYLEQEKRRDKEAQELEEEKAKLDRLQVALSEAIKKYDNEAKMNSDMANLRKKINDLDKEKLKLIDEKQEIQNNFEHNVFPEIARCRSKISQLEDVDKKRLKTLEMYSSDTYKALLWLRENRQQFGEVCEPMMLEIRFPDRQYARYVEATVARRDLAAFTFQNSDDMDRFISTVRGKMGLRMVNAVCSPPSNDTFQSPDIRKISQYGFQKYVSQTFTAHDMIMRYLCRTYNIHRIPIGNQHTYNNSENVPADITLFFTDNHRFSVRISKYSRDKSTSFTDIQPEFLLADTIDTNKINEFKARLSQLQKEQQKYQDKKGELDARLAAKANEATTYNSKLDEIQNHIRHIRRLTIDIKQQETVVENKSRPSIDLKELRARCARDQRKCVEKQVKVLSELEPVVQHIHTDSLLDQLVTMVLRKKRRAKGQLENSFHELNKEISEVEEQFKHAQRLEDQATQKAASKLREALRSSSDRRPEDPRFPCRDLYRRLPSSLQELQDHCNEVRTRIDCMSTSDESDVQTYERNAQEIEQLSAEENSVRQEQQAMETAMERTKKRWIQFVKRLIEKINLRFREMFQQLGFGGEVRLKHGPSEDDFSSYGVSIMVKFRESELLSELGPLKQSGGERAVSTAVYLFALQKLARVPFRCVDEINQGMDSANERKILEFLFNVTTEGEQGQYFLLTPKLMTGLEYNDKVTVHTIMNGVGAVSCDKWQMDSFVNNLRNYRPM